MNTIKHYKIGELAALTGLTVEAIRFYESKGLVKASQRSDAGYRLFSASDISRLSFILRAKAVGFTLQEIGELLELRLHADEHSCAEVKQVTADKISEIKSKIDELQKIQSSLETMHQACCGGPESAKNCTILHILDNQY